MTIADPPSDTSNETYAPSRELLDSLPEHAGEHILTLMRVGAFGEALIVAIERGDLDLAVDVLRVGWFDLLKDVHRSHVIDALEGLSAAQLMSHPLLAMALGLAINGDGFRRSKAVHYFGLAATGVRSLPTRLSPAERALVLASESSALRLIGKHALSVSSARAGVKTLDGMREERAALIGYLPRVYSQLGISLFYGDQEDEALRVFARGYAEAGTSDRSSFGNLSMSAGIHALSGNLAEAREFVLLARGEPWTDEQRRMYPGTFYRLAEAMLALEDADTTGAQTHLDTMEHDRRSIEHWTAIVRVQGLARLLGGDPSLGLAELEEYSALRQGDGDPRAVRQRLSSTRSLLHVALGNYTAAERILRTDAGKRPQDHVDRARLALATDRTGEALKELRSIAGSPQSARTHLEALAIEAAAGLRTGRDRRTGAVLQQLIAMMRQTDQRIAIQLVPPQDALVLADALTAEGAHDLTRRWAPQPLLAHTDGPQLTGREQAVLNALSRSGVLSEIAGELFVSVNTVKSHLKRLYKKLGARNREEALAAAFHHHLLSPPVDR
ncbi:helix-turn-helix transcriptional regulator [Microbacterium sp. CIAB417]|uniref:helix-turn-helix domain-containing protein n=1 Tax=Microbacterium sp. CIAB417 TaxID=2860287 RepID=UPI001FAC8EA2|nr:helix-turn-helix transcriptional regulator [Microbacterium sp. CIAB417]